MRAGFSLSWVWAETPTDWPGLEARAYGPLEPALVLSNASYNCVKFVCRKWDTVSFRTQSSLKWCRKTVTGIIPAEIRTFFLPKGALCSVHWSCAHLRARLERAIFTGTLPLSQFTCHCGYQFHSILILCTWTYMLSGFRADMLCIWTHISTHMMTSKLV
jgi:hypothetical protein